MSYNILVRKESNDMGDELCPAGRAVAQPTSALFHGDTVFLHDLDDVCLSFSRRVIAVLLCVYIRTFHFSHIRPPVKMIIAGPGLERAM